MLACVPQFVGGSQLYWPEPGTAGIVRPDISTPTLRTIDLVTGETTDTGKPIPFDPDNKGGGIFGGAYSPDGTFASVSEDGTLTLLSGGVRTNVTKFDSPKYSQPQVILWSPDSQWIVLRYFPRRADGPEIWIVSRDATIQGTLLKDASYSGVAWRIGDDVQPKLPD
jgi:hypothetical protein